MSLDDLGFLSKEILQYRQHIHQRYPAHFALIYRVNTFCQRAKYAINIHNKDGQEIVAASLMIKLLNDRQAAVLLIEHGLGSQARTLIRAGVETFFVLANICKDEEFFRTFFRTDQLTRRKHLNALLADKSVTFEDVRPHIMPELIGKLTEDIKSYDIQDIKAEALARQAGLMAFYNGPYRLFSHDVHASIRVVEDYCTFNQNKEITGFTWGPKYDDLEAELTVIPRIMLNSFGYLDRLFDLHLGTELSKPDAELRPLEWPPGSTVTQPRPPSPSSGKEI
jgi:hypothetical protein